jgi:hypothetical protein
MLCQVRDWSAIFQLHPLMSRDPTLFVDTWFRMFGHAAKRARYLIMPMTERDVEKPCVIARTLHIMVNTARIEGCLVMQFYHADW